MGAAFVFLSNLDFKSLTSVGTEIAIWREIFYWDELRLSVSGVSVTIKEIPYKHGMLRRHEPMCLFASQSSDGKYFTVHVPDLDMPVTESSLEELDEAVREVLGLAWQVYVMGDSEKMMPDAQGLAERLSEIYKPV